MDSAPFIQFYLTLRCNADCHFCFNKGLPATDDVKIDDFEKMVAILRGAGIQCIDILGGEPTLHHGLIPLLDIIKAQGMKSNLSTNGTHVPLLHALSERHGDDFLTIGVSLPTHDISDDLHDYIIRHRPVLKSVLIKGKALPLPGERYMGLPGVRYFLLYMDAVNNHDLAYSMPFYRFHRELLKLKERYESLDGVFCSGFIPSRDDHPLLKSVRCPAGTTKLSIRPDGSVYPCYLFFRYQEFQIGNILRDNFQKIWQHPVLNRFRTFHRNTCTNRSCALYPSCHGGCPAISYIFHRDCDAPDPRCRQ